MENFHERLHAIVVVGFVVMFKLSYEVMGSSVHEIRLVQVCFGI